MTFTLDLLLAVLMLAVAGWTIAARDTFAAVVGFVSFGLMLALVWVRLGAVDVATEPTDPLTLDEVADATRVVSDALDTGAGVLPVVHWSLAKAVTDVKTVSPTRAEHLSVWLSMPARAAWWVSRLAPSLYQRIMARKLQDEMIP